MTLLAEIAEAAILVLFRGLTTLYITADRGRRAQGSPGGFESLNARMSWSRFAGCTASECTDERVSRVRRNCCR
jgi:hypothetical protein